MPDLEFVIEKIGYVYFIRDSLNPDLDTDADPDTDPDSAFQVNPDTLRMQGFDDQKLKKKTAKKFFSFLIKKLQFIYP